MRPFEIFTVREGRTVPVTVSITLAFLKMYILGGGRFQGLMRCSEAILKVEFMCEEIVWDASCKIERKAPAVVGKMKAGVQTRHGQCDLHSDK